MKKGLICFLLLVAFVLSAFTGHKFYVSIYKIDYAAPKKRLELTARIFVDDLNLAIEKKYGQKVFLGEQNETAADVEQVKKYLIAHLHVKVNGKRVSFEYLSHQYESNVWIGYFRFNAIQKIKSLEITNTTLTDYIDQQQNIVQTNINGEKNSVVFTAENPIKNYSF